MKKDFEILNNIEREYRARRIARRNIVTVEVTEICYDNTTGEQWSNKAVLSEVEFDKVKDAFEPIRLIEWSPLTEYAGMRDVSITNALKAANKGTIPTIQVGATRLIHTGGIPLEQRVRAIINREDKRKKEKNNNDTRNI